jgi:hypothetical protein
VCLAGCNRASLDKEAVRQGIVEHLKARSFDLAKMEVDLTTVKVNGDHADATVSFYPKGSSSAQGMSMNYQLERQNGKWSVVGRTDTGGTPHGGGALPGGAMPGAASPPGGAMPGAASPPGGAAMPPPEDLPPAGKKH